MNTMWCYALVAPKRLAAKNTQKPAHESLSPGDVLVQTEAGGICGSDLEYFSGGPIRLPLRKPKAGSSPPGASMHEIAGVVVATRDPSLAVGAKVVGWADDHLGLAEFVVTPGAALIEYDADAYSAVQAVALQSLACVIYAVDRISHKVQGSTVAVIGQGPIGTLFSHVLKSAGASKVIGIDRVDHSAEAAEFGVDEYVTSSAEKWAANLDDTPRPAVVVEAVGHNTSTIFVAAEAVATQGLIYYFGVPDEDVYAFPMAQLFRKNATLLTGVTIDKRGALRKAASYADMHPGLLEQFVTHSFPLTKAEAAYQLACNPAPGQFKIVVDFAVPE